MKSTRSQSQRSSVEMWRHDVRASSDLPRNSNAEANPPSYSQIADFDFHEPICCAFGKLRECTRDSVYLELERKPPLYMLLCWVALVRNNDSGLAPEDRQRCPSPWCDVAFPESDLMELINHVSECSKMSHGAYVCPYHHRTEPFMTIPDGQLEHRSRRHFFKHAFDAICKLGSKGIKRAIHPSKQGARVEFKTGGRKRLRSSADLKDTISNPQAFDPQLLFPDDGLIVADEDATPIAQPQAAKRMSLHSTSELPSTRSMYHEMEAFAHPPAAELASHRMSRLTTSDGTPASGSNSDFSNSPVSPISSNHWTDARDFASPVSPVGNPFQPTPWPSAMGIQPVPSQVPQQSEFVTPDQLNANGSVPVQAVDAGPWMPASHGHASPRSFPKIRIDTSLATTPPPAEPFEVTPPQQPGQSSQNLSVIPSPFQIASDNQSPTKSVEELRGLFCRVFELSCTKISQPPLSPAGETLLKARPTPAFLFERGCRALSKVLHGVLPSSFWEIFGLAHLAYASALANQEPDLVALLPEMYEDLARWSEAVKIRADRAGFLNLIRQLFTPENHSLERLALGSRIRESSTRTRRANTSGASVSLSDLNRLWSTGRPGGQNDNAFQQPGFTKTDQTLLLSLKQGVVVQLCLRYLGSLEYLTQEASNALNPAFIDLDGQSPTISNSTARSTYILRKHVLDQLLVERGIEGFRAVIEDAVLMLSASPQTSLRDLELYLLQEAKGYAKSQAVYKKYLTRVSELCDRAAGSVGWDLGSREQYYLRDVEQVLATHRDLLAATGVPNLPPSELPPQINANVPSDPWILPSDAAVTPAGGEPFQFAFPTTTPTSTSNSPATNDPTFSWTPEPSAAAGPPANIPAPTTYVTPPPPPASAPANTTPTRPPKARQRPEPLSHAALATTADGGPGPALTGVAPPGPSPTSDQTDGTLTCHVCGKKLQGKLVYLPSNMKRHLRELHSPAARRLACRVEGCGRAFIRNHNLLHHQRTVHQMKV